MTTPAPAFAGRGPSPRSPYFHAYALRPLPGSLCLRSALPLISDDAPTQWVHMAYEGAWEGHADGGFALTPEVFAQVVANFQSQVNPLPLDFDHEREFMAPPWPARGWVHELKVEEGKDGKAHLWGLVEFGPEAVRYNKQGGYRYCSIVIDFESSDRVTGEPTGARLRSLALTDDPFLDGQRPIRLSRRAAAPTTKRTLMQKLTKEALLAALDQFEGDEIDMEQLEAAAHLAAVKDGGSEEPEAPEADMADKPEEEPPAAMADDEPEDQLEASAPAGEGVELAEDPGEPAASDTTEDQATAAIAPLAEDLGVSVVEVAAMLMEKRAEVASLLQGGGAGAAMSDREAQLALSARDHTIKSLSARLDELEQYKAKREDEDATSWAHGLRDAGKISDADVGEWKSLRLSNRESAEKLSRSLSMAVPAKPHSVAVEPPTEGEDATEIPEDDSLVKDMRRSFTALGGKWADRDVQNKAIRKALSGRINGKTPARANA